MRVQGTTGPRLHDEGKRADVIRQLTLALGGRMIPDAQHANCDLFIQWGMRKTPHFRQSIRDGMVVVTLDRGYFDGTRNQTFSISVNGVHGLSQPLDSVLDRAPRPHPPLQPWRDDRQPGQFVQVIAPGWSPGYWRTPAHRLPEGWVTNIAAEVSSTFGLPAKIHYHPKALPEGMRRSAPLATTFEETHVSVSYMSLAAVQTVIAGVPSIVYHPRSLAFPMAAHDMNIYRPDREAWIHDLSHRQYGFNEVLEAQDYILAQYDQAKRKGPLKGPLIQYGIKGE
jgi:hypothetical protein